ncbi:MAG: hypothetical protein K1000chlam2_01131 [Chlamydiae bacterium]|nr:hypothetical protein [Chlamydiota bacterium]
MEVERIELSSLDNFSINDYMLITFSFAVASDGRCPRGKQLALLNLESQSQKAERIRFIPGNMTVILKSLVRSRSPRCLNC